MTNVEIMTKLETRNRPERRFSSFVIRHFFGLRHSPARRSLGEGGSFVIFSRLMLVLFVMLSISCSGKRITKANVDEITQGMSRKQVESVLGPPTSRMKDVYVYRQGKDTVAIVFKDDKVQSKKSTLSD